MKHLIIPFLFKLDRSLQHLTGHLDMTNGTAVDKIELIQKWTQIFNMKEYVQRGKIGQRIITAN